MKKNSFKVALIFSLLVFMIISVTMILAGAATVLLYNFELVGNQHQELHILIFALVSIVMGTLLSRVVGKRPIDMIIRVSEATKEIAKGNYNIRLEENVRAAEIQTMNRNFNIMAKELANTEMFRNDFIENVSHEFKTPLAAIEGYATLLQSKSLTEQKREDYTKKILHNTKRLSSLTRNILLLSSIENHEIKIKKETYSLDEQLREIILLFEEQWSAKNLELDIELDSINYYGNKEFLAHVWQNIISNAIKFVGNQGCIQVLLHQDGDHVVVSIVDNGVGMNKEVMQRVYEKFYQGDTSRTAAGNGLGLTLAKRIVDLHEGEIAVSSKEGKGTSFTVTLPVMGAERTPPFGSVGFLMV